MLIFVNNSFLRIRFILIAFFYLFVNFLFILKYGEKLNFVSAQIIIYLYISIVLILFFWFYKISKLNKNLLNFTIIYFIVFLTLINIFINPLYLNVDRWSAMEAGIKSIINGEYPYTALDHLGGRTSNLPGLFLIGLPFYFIGDVGLLQVFTFILMVFSLKYIYQNIKHQTLIIILFILSPAYLWEIYVKSDLMSNIILAIILMIWIDHRVNANKLINWKLLGLIVGILVLTRIIIVIPLVLTLSYEFFQTTRRNKANFIFFSLMTMGLLLFITFINCPNFETLQNYNPLLLQGRISPTWLNLSVLILPFVIGLKRSNIKFKLWTSMILMGIPITFAFTESLIKNGINKILFENYFDISYLGMLLPFTVFLIPYDIIENKNENKFLK